MRWKTWAQPRREVTVFPIEEVHFAFYLQHLADTTKSKATVEEAVNAISWGHQLAGQPTINTSAFVHDTVVGLQQKGSVYCTTVKAECRLNFLALKIMNLFFPAVIPFYEEPWFIPAVAGGGAALVFVVLLV